jgi:hypothetical protein
LQHFFCIKNHLTTGFGKIFGRETGEPAGIGLDDHPMALFYQRMHPGRGDANSPFIMLGFCGNAD